MQLGGLGILTATSIVTLVLFRRLGLRSRLTTRLESGTADLGGVGGVVVRVLLLSLVVEAVVAAVLTARFAVLGADAGTALWRGVFHGVSAFNNAGFALFPDSMASYALDEWITVPLMVAVVLGGLGFPVLLECCERRAPPARGACTPG